LIEFIDLVPLVVFFLLGHKDVLLIRLLHLTLNIVILLATFRLVATSFPATFVYAVTTTLTGMASFIGSPFQLQIFFFDMVVFTILLVVVMLLLMAGHVLLLTCLAVMWLRVPVGLLLVPSLMLGLVRMAVLLRLYLLLLRLLLQLSLLLGTTIPIPSTTSAATLSS
jgi:hypothetical protein